jgi:phospholipid/cholesterol/gamma-HCH transport system substrate-binding protein
VIFLLLAAVGGALWYLVSASTYATFQIRTQDPVSGLIADSPVEFHGVEVGKVKSVELTDPHTVTVLLSIKKDAPVSTATVATITGRGLATRGFTGYVYVSLENLGSDARPLTAAAGSRFPVIPTAASRSVNLDTAISQLSQNVQSMTDLLQSVLDQKTVASLKQAVDGFQQVSQTLAANQGKLASTIARAERASARLEPLFQSSEATVRILQAQILPEAHQTFAKLDRLTSTQVEPLLQSSNDAVKALQIQVLPEAYRTLAKLDQLSTSLSDVTARIKRDPSVLIRGSSALAGPGETR